MTDWTDYSHIKDFANVSTFPVTPGQYDLFKSFKDYYSQYSKILNLSSRKIHTLEQFYSGWIADKKN